MIGINLLPAEYRKGLSAQPLDGDHLAKSLEANFV